MTLSVLAVSCKTQKDIIGGGTISAKDYPYIEKFHKALRFKATGRLEEARGLLQECLQMKQDDDAVYYALSKTELSLGNELKSSVYIQKAAELDPANLWYTQELAYMFFETQDYTNSVANFKKLVDAEPRNVDWLYGYAEALVQAGESEKAIDALQKTEDQIGRYPDIIVQKHKLYVSLKKMDKAEEELLVAKAEFPKDPLIIATLVDFYFKQNQQEKAIQMLEELVEADPGNGRAHLTLADLYQQQGNKLKAYEELRLAFLSDDIDIDTKMRILIKIHESVYKIDEEIYALVDLMLEQYPEDPKAHSIKGDYMLRKEDEAAALIAYQNALKYDKTQYPIWSQVLIMLYQKGDFEDLYAYSTECLEYFPTISTVYLLNGVASNQLKKYQEALDILSVGQELILNDPPLKAEFYGQLGESYFGIGEPKSAIEKYKKAIDLAPGSALIRNNFAFQLANYKVDLELALSMIKQAMEAAPEQPQFIDTYGWVLFQQDKFEEAKEQFEKAYSINATDKLNLEHLGDVWSKLNKVEKALSFWNEALKLNENSVSLKKKIADKKYYDPNN